MSPYEDAYQLIHVNFVGFQHLNFLKKWKKLERNLKETLLYTNFHSWQSQEMHSKVLSYEKFQMWKSATAYTPSKFRNQNPAFSNLLHFETRDNWDRT